MFENDEISFFQFFFCVVYFGMCMVTQKRTVSWLVGALSPVNLTGLVSWCFEPSQPHRVISGLTKRHTQLVS